MSTESVSTERLWDLLRAKFGPPAYGLLFEVPSATGLGKVRSADALAMSLWPSRGIELHGFELKVSRSDWQKELSDPSKAEAVCQFCDRWWLVAGDKGIVRDGELPATWGLLVASGGGLRIAVPAPQLEPKPITRHFLAAVFRRLAEQSFTQADIRAAEQKGYESGKARTAKHGDTDSLVMQHEHKRMKESISKFREASGVDLEQDSWRAGSIGEAVKQILADKQAVQNARRDVKVALENVRRLYESMQKNYGQDA